MLWIQISCQRYTENEWKRNHKNNIYIYSIIQSGTLHNETPSVDAPPLRHFVNTYVKLEAHSILKIQIKFGHYSRILKWSIYLLHLLIYIVNPNLMPNIRKHYTSNIGKRYTFWSRILRMCEKWTTKIICTFNFTNTKWCFTQWDTYHACSPIETFFIKNIKKSIQDIW